MWNVLDFIVLLSIVVNTLTSLIVIGGVSRFTRALTAVRALRIITLSARLRETFYAVFISGVVRLLEASTLLVLYLIPFAIWGSAIFSGRLYACNNGNASGKADCIVEYMASPVDDSLSFIAPQAWDNPSFDGSRWTFDDFRHSILILFEVLSLEGWVDVMQSMMNIVGVDENAQDQASPYNALFMVTYMLFGGVVIMSAWLAIIIANFARTNGTSMLTMPQQRWVALKSFLQQQRPSRRPDERVNGLRAWCYQRAARKRGYWSRGYLAFLCLHVLLLSYVPTELAILTLPNDRFTGPRTIRKIYSPKPQ